MAANTDRRPWGSTPPLLSLSEACDLVERFYAESGGQGNYDTLSRIAGNSTSSSSFVRKLGALKTYGLVHEPNKGTLALSDAGSKIAAPLSPESSADAKKEAFLRVKVFGQVYERHKGKLLPADEFLKNMIEQESGIPRELSSEWLLAFKDAVRTAGLLHDRGDGKMQIMESSAVPRTPVLVMPGVARPDKSEVAAPGGAALTRDTNGEANGHITRIELSGERRAVFSIPDRLTATDARKLKAVLSGLGSIIESLVADNGTEA